jgi:DNA-binding LacI/PurR family transcriptional regulator
MISSLDLARLCGVSQGTVDRALHGRPGISAATRERVLAMAREHGYRPNPAARELMGRTAPTLVGAVLAESAVQGPFFMDLLRAVADALRRHGLRLAATFCDATAADQRQAIEELVARRPRGLLVVHPHPDLRPPVGSTVPFAAVVTPLGVPGCHDLLPDEVATGGLAARHLLELGHRRLLHLGTGAGHPVARDRRAGFVAAARAAGATVAVHDGPADDAALAAIAACGATAVACHHDPLALALIDRLVAGGVRVPGAVSVLGVDGGTLPALRGIPLTTLAYPHAGIAAAAAAVMLDRPVPEIPDCVVQAGATTAAPAR